MRKYIARVEIPENRIRDLLCCGIEGGIGYWAKLVRYEYGPGYSEKDFKEGGKMTDPNDYWHPSELIPFADDCSVVFQEENDDPKEVKEWKLNRLAISVGLTIMMNKYPKHAIDFLQENEDAETGDVFIQCCLLGEVVYG